MLRNENELDLCELDLAVWHACIFFPVHLARSLYTHVIYDAYFADPRPAAARACIIMTRRVRAVLEMTHFIKHVQHNAKCINAT